MKTIFDPKPITLESDFVRLEPLKLSHASDLHEAGQEESIWEYLPLSIPKVIEDTQSWIKDACEETESGESVAFAIIDRNSNQAIGSTRYLNIQPNDRILEIGYTWLGTQYQRTRINTECKLMLLSHAFEELGAVMVKFKTDLRNEPSKKAIERIGGIQDTIIRNHKVGDIIRDSIFYRITASEWPGVKLRLRGMLARS